MTPTYLLLGPSHAALSELSATLFPDPSDLHILLLPGNPIDALEAFPAKARQENLQLARIIALVNAAELERRRELTEWFRALTHFADVLLLSHTREVSPAWLTSLRKSLKDRPLEIILWPEALKKNADSVIADITFPEARRLSQYFDIDPDAVAPIFASTDEDSVEIEEERDFDDTSAEDATPEEAYFARDAAGRRSIKITSP